MLSKIFVQYENFFFFLIPQQILFLSEFRVKFIVFKKLRQLHTLKKVFFFLCDASKKLLQKLLEFCLYQLFHLMCFGTTTFSKNLRNLKTSSLMLCRETYKDFENWGKCQKPLVWSNKRVVWLSGTLKLAYNLLNTFVVVFFSFKSNTKTK